MNRYFFIILTLFILSCQTNNKRDIMGIEQHRRDFAKQEKNRIREYNNWREILNKMYKLSDKGLNQALDYQKKMLKTKELDNLKKSDLYLHMGIIYYQYNHINKALLHLSNAEKYTYSIVIDSYKAACFSKKGNYSKAIKLMRSAKKNI